MRQAGVIAAAALFALKNNISRLREDHEKAQMLANAVEETPGLELTRKQVDTNIVIFQIADGSPQAATLVEHLKANGILTFSVSPTAIRAVTHLDVSHEQIERACQVIRDSAAVVA